MRLDRRPRCSRQRAMANDRRRRLSRAPAASTSSASSARSRRGRARAGSSASLRSSSRVRPGRRCARAVGQRRRPVVDAIRRMRPRLRACPGSAALAPIRTSSASPGNCAAAAASHASLQGVAPCTHRQTGSGDNFGTMVQFGSGRGLSAMPTRTVTKAAAVSRARKRCAGFGQRGHRLDCAGLSHGISACSLFRRLFTLFAWLWRLLRGPVLLAIGGLTGFLVPYLITLDQQVRERFDDLSWQIPSRVFARPLDLEPGRPMNADTLLLELEAARYRADAAARCRPAPMPATAIASSSAGAPSSVSMAAMRRNVCRSIWPAGGSPVLADSGQRPGPAARRARSGADRHACMACNRKSAAWSSSNSCRPCS